jgi:hypothetical protein
MPTRRLRSVLRMRALQDSALVEIRGLLRVLLVRHEQVPADAAVGRLLRPLTPKRFNLS